ncbi:MAG TPA: dienelactone hydrolase family protein [Ktedonobacteraceae bacterium]|nr:dienelactone hydrolase family protein [Ktedonobacteraceae bacterium]
MDTTSQGNNIDRLVQVAAGALFLDGHLTIPENARGIVLFPYAIENEQRVSYTAGLAWLLNEQGIATLLVDLLTPEEKALDKETGFFRENVNVLHQRIIGIANWLIETPETQNLRICYFGVGVTGAAVLIAAAKRPDAVVTVIATAERLDLARDYLPRVEAPVLLLAGENDSQANESSRLTLEQLRAEKKLETIGGAGHLFEDTSTLEEVARLAIQWFEQHLRLG